MMLLLTRWVAPRTRAGFRAQQATLGKLNGLIEETITGQRVVKAYGREAAAIGEFDTANQTLPPAATQAQIFAGFIGPMMNFVNNLGLAIVAGAGGWMAVQGLATVGTIASFINYSAPVRPAAQRDRQPLQHDPVGDRRRRARLRRSSTSPPSRGRRRTQRPLLPAADEGRKGDVVFDDVSFAYEPGTPVLKHVSLHAQPGQIVALVGPTGAGKTTIVNLLTRFYDVDSGRISIDGHDIRADPQGRPAPPARHRAAGHLSLHRHGDGEHPLRPARRDRRRGDRRRQAGQRRPVHPPPAAGLRHAAVRARQQPEPGPAPAAGHRPRHPGRPGILILDEATSSVDTRTEQHIQEAMLRLMTGRTSFVIAHRLSTIRDADQILVHQPRRDRRAGPHEELLAQGGFYAHLYASQFAHQSAIPAAN